MTLTRDDVLWRSAHIWPKGGVPYSQHAYRAGYRTDCSGYVLLSWEEPTSYNTASMVAAGIMRPIDPDQLQPGDAVGWCGPGSEGDAGHVRLFVRWVNDIDSDNRHVIREQAGGRSGWTERTVDWGGRMGGIPYRAYRWRGFPNGGPVPTPAPTPAPTSSTPYPLHPYPPHVFGPYSHPSDAVHGGYNGWERPFVRQLQEAVWAHGFNPGPSDGIYGSRTTAAVVAYQRAARLQPDGIVGPITWRALLG